MRLLPRPDTLVVHFIDVGQGSTVLIQFIDRHTNILYDCGDTGKGKTVWEYLKVQGVTRLDLLIASHAHRDHIGGCTVLLQRMAVKKVDDNASPSLTGTHKTFKCLAREKASYASLTGDITTHGLHFLVA